MKPERMTPEQVANALAIGRRLLEAIGSPESVELWLRFSPAQRRRILTYRALSDTQAGQWLYYSFIRPSPSPGSAR